MRVAFNRGLTNGLEILVAKATIAVTLKTCNSEPADQIMQLVVLLISIPVVLLQPAYVEGVDPLLVDHFFCLKRRCPTPFSFMLNSKSRY